jgi:hypothetical protein
MAELTAKELRSVLRYEPETGQFYWLIGNHGRKIGKIAGHLSKRYTDIRVNGKTHHAHRLAFLYMTGEWPSEVDHRNRDGHDNRWPNLRVTTASQNQFNRQFRQRDLPRGVEFDAENQRYRGRLSVNRARHGTPWFKTASEAHEAYLMLARKFYGELVSDI